MPPSQKQYRQFIQSCRLDVNGVSSLSIPDHDRIEPSEIQGEPCTCVMKIRVLKVSNKNRPFQCFSFKALMELTRNLSLLFSLWAIYYTVLADHLIAWAQCCQIGQKTPQQHTQKIGRIIKFIPKHKSPEEGIREFLFYPRHKAWLYGFITPLLYYVIISRGSNVSARSSSGLAR